MRESESVSEIKPDVNKKTRQSRILKVDSSQNRNSFADRIMFLQRTVGNQAIGRMISSGAIKAKLKIGKPGDQYEQEADRVADQVMRMPEPDKVSSGNFYIQRTCPECEENGIENQIQSIKGGGSPLSGKERAFFEPRFGADFSRVRLHTDSNAAKSARAVNALAYTTGQDIVFGSGQYNLQSKRGQYLLAHELVHTIQQAGSLHGMMIQRMIRCPPVLNAADPVPSGWKAYNGNPCWFHCCYRGILENRRPSPEDPQNECFYDNNGVLVDAAHENAGCRGTPNQYDSASDWWRHTFRDSGGIWAKGWGAFWSSRWHDLNQHFEQEGSRMLECHEICNQQPWYLRGFCLQGCSGTPPLM